MQVKTKNMWKSNEDSNEHLKKQNQDKILLKLKTRYVPLPCFVKLNTV